MDVEGSEFQILKTIPFHEADIKIIDLEITHLGEIFPGTLWAVIVIKKSDRGKNIKIIYMTY